MSGLEVEPLYSATALERVARDRDSFKLTVARVWDALGNPAYETLEGRSISEVVANWRSRAEKAEAELATLRARLETVEAETRERCAKVADLRAEELAARGLPSRSHDLAMQSQGARSAAAAIRNLEPRHD